MALSTSRQLDQRRKHLGLSQARLAQMLKISESTLSLQLRGIVSMPKARVRKIADLLAMPEDEVASELAGRRKARVKCLRMAQGIDPLVVLALLPEGTAVVERVIRRLIGTTDTDMKKETER